MTRMIQEADQPMWFSKAEIPPPPTPVARRRAAAAGAVPTTTAASSSSGSSGYSMVDEPGFTVGAFSGMTFRNIHEKYPTQYTKMKTAVQKDKNLPPE